MSQLARMRRGSLRRLTAGEQARVREIFGRSLDPERVRIYAQPISWWRRAFVASGRLIVWPWAAAAADFAAEETPLRLQATFVHEMVHVWQAQQGINLLFAKLACGDGPAAYAYEITEGCRFADFNIEQQAMAVEHAFLARRGVRTPYPEPAYAAFLPDWLRRDA